MCTVLRDMHEHAHTCVHIEECHTHHVLAVLFLFYGLEDLYLPEWSLLWQTALKVDISFCACEDWCAHIGGTRLTVG